MSSTLAVWMILCVNQIWVWWILEDLMGFGHSLTRDGYRPDRFGYILYLQSGHELSRVPSSYSNTLENGHAGAWFSIPGAWKVLERGWQVQAAADRCRQRDVRTGQLQLLVVASESQSTLIKSKPKTSIRLQYLHPSHFITHPSTLER